MYTVRVQFELVVAVIVVNLLYLRCLQFVAVVSQERHTSEARHVLSFVNRIHNLNGVEIRIRAIDSDLSGSNRRLRRARFVDDINARFAHHRLRCHRCVCRCCAVSELCISSLNIAHDHELFTDSTI